MNEVIKDQVDSTDPVKGNENFTYDWEKDHLNNIRITALNMAIELTKNGNAESVIGDAVKFEKYITDGADDGHNSTR